MKKILIQNVFEKTYPTVSCFDTAFIERLYNLIFYYKISTFYSDCVILLDSGFWPEFIFLSAPNVQCVDFNNLNLNLSKIEPIDPYLLVDKVKNPNSNINLFHKNNILISKFSSNSNLKLLNILFNFDNNFDKFFIKKITFKDENLNLFFKDNFSECFSFQLRRGVGTLPNRQYLIDLKNNNISFKEVLSYYIKIGKLNSTPNFIIKNDDYYYNILDNIISSYPNKKIYLSHDVPKQFINYYLEKYPNNLVTKEDYILEYLKYFKDFDLNRKDEYNISLFVHVINLLDLFSLSYSEGIIPCESGWTDFANKYRDKKLNEETDYSS